MISWWWYAAGHTVLLVARVKCALAHRPESDLNGGWPKGAAALFSGARCQMGYDANRWAYDVDAAE